jgi:hypothetical protein
MWQVSDESTAVLQGQLDRAVARLADLRNLKTKRIDAYKATPLAEERTVHDLVVRSVYSRALPGSHIVDALNEWRMPRHEEFQPRTVWSLFNAFIETLKGSLTLLPSRTQALHGLLDSHVGLLLARPESSAETHVEIAA